MYGHLTAVYQERARYTVIFISHYYRDKVWTNHERRAAHARALAENQEYILPTRFDSTEIEGILPTTAYLDLRRFSPAQVSVLICQKLGHDTLQSKAHELPSPRVEAVQGDAKFNYSSYNGRFRIGEGVCLFETRWSKASDTRIHCYTDTPSVRGVALAPRDAALDDVTDDSELDYSSRVRTAEEGRIVVLQNNHGFYAAILVVDVKDDARGEENDEITFRYWILTNGTKDFSKVKPA